MNHDDTAGARSDGSLERKKVDLPAVVVDKGVADESYVVDIGEEAEERIAGGGDEELIAGITKGAKNIGVGFTGASGENDVAERNLGIAGDVVGGDGAAGVFEAS